MIKKTRSFFILTVFIPLTWIYIEMETTVMGKYLVDPQKVCLGDLSN